MNGFALIFCLVGVTSAHAVFIGKMNGKAALKTVVADAVVGGARSAATAVVAVGVKEVTTRSHSNAAAGYVARRSGPLADVGCVVEVFSDV